MAGWASLDAATVPGKALRVVVADDHALFRQGLTAVLSAQPDIEVVAEADRLDLTASALQSHPCDVLLLDLWMDRCAHDDIPSFAAIAPVLVITASESDDEALTAIRLGARGVVAKRFAVETLLTAIRCVAAGQVWIPASLQAGLVARLRQGADPLTPREREIVRHVASGLRNAEVAKKLFVSQVTVKTHLNNIFRKLGCRDRVELTLYAARAGIVQLYQPQA